MTAPDASGGAPWWAGIAAAEMALDCGGGRHRVRWALGALSAPDHADADRERALVALGGERVPCLDLLDAWNAHSDDLDLLVFASRGPSDRLTELEPGQVVRYSGGYTSKSGFSTFSRAGMPGRRYGRGRGWTPMYLASNSGADESDGAGPIVSRLANLPAGLTDRLVATVIATWADRIRDGDGRVAAAAPRLQAALYGRVLAAIRGLGHGDPIDLVMVGAQAPRSITAGDARIRCELPFSWLGDVWAKGFATVLGHLCLNVAAAGGGSWRLLVSGPDLRGTKAMTVDLTE